MTRSGRNISMLSSQEKKFHSADERVFKEAERILFGEFGFVLGIHPSEVPAFIDDRIGDQMKSVS